MGPISAFTRAGACSAPALSISCTMRLPMITASAICAMARADSASLMPKPTPTGRLVAARMRGRCAAMSATSALFTPVTPFNDT
ncbi:hypothetical protein D3C83_70950 [compost metagenome]